MRTVAKWCSRAAPAQEPQQTYENSGAHVHSELETGNNIG